jgi:hypothetical protein
MPPIVGVLVKVAGNVTCAADSKSIGAWLAANVAHRMTTTLARTSPTCVHFVPLILNSCVAKIIRLIRLI